MPAGPFHRKHTRSVRVDLTSYTGHAYVEIGQTRLISSDRTCIYHHPRGARWARGPRWSLRSLNTIVALLKAEIFSPTLIIIIMSAEQSDTCVIWTHFFTFDPREPFRPTFPSDPRGPLTTHTGAEGVRQRLQRQNRAVEELKQSHTGGPGKPGCPWKPLK